VNILHVTPLYAPAWQFGGVVRSVSTLAEQCAAKGARVSVVTTAIGTPFEGLSKPHAEERRGVRVTYCPGRRMPIGILSRDLTRAAAAALPAIDICHITGVWQPSVVPAARLCRASGVPYVTSPRGALSPYSFRDGWLKKHLYFRLCERAVQRDASALHATSPLEEQELRHLLPKAAVEVIPNICDSTRWFSDREGGARWRAAKGIGPGTAVFLHVGRIEPKKNLPFLGEVARGLPSESDWVFVLVGPAEKSELGRVTTAFGHAANRLITVPGTGSEDELRAAYSTATCLVMPSFHENFGNVVLEAIYCGTPVIASDQVGVAEMIAASPYVEVLPLRRNEWANALAGMGRECGSGLSSSGLHELRNQFSGAGVADQMIHFYESVLT
jgi:glycosyltransferase involved in cell wall biosynthesis